MQIHISPTSPYARKVRVFCQLAQVPPIEWIVSKPFEVSYLRELNPLGKIPVLVSTSITLFDSSLICEYLDDAHVQAGGQSLYGKGSPDYYAVQKTHYLANGILDAAVDKMMESRRSDAEISSYWQGRRTASIESGLASIKVADCYLGSSLNIAGVALACTLGYLQFRLPQLQVRDFNAEAAQWFDDIAQAPWFLPSQPKD